MSVDSIVEDFADAFQDFGAKRGQISKQTLCKILYHLDSSWTQKRLEHLLDGFGDQDLNVDTYKFFDWIIHPEPSLLELPVKCRSERQRSQFLTDQWEPFQKEVQDLLQRTTARAEAGYSLHEIMPSHLRLRTLTDKCRSLTQAWHGQANISYIYEMFMKMAELDGHSAYFFQDIPKQRSDDGFVRVLDGEARARLYSGSKSRPRKCLALVGRMQQTTGESPIDNLQLPNLLRRHDALLLTVGRRLQQFFVWALRWKQRRILNTFSLKDHLAVRAQAKALQGEHDDTSLALSLLVQHGCLVESYGQVPQEVRTGADEFIADCLRRQCPERELDEELADFLKHCNTNPGRPYKANRVEHKLLLLKALRSPELRVMWRSDVEAFTQHRYITATWTRRAPLYYLQDGDFLLLRSPGDEECSRFRKNIFAYAESHGLGQSGGGWTDGSHWPKGSLMYELGSLLCVDDAAKLPNHFVTDIEKIVQDCVLLCPDPANPLPGEVLHDAGQNPIIASSIGKSQHTQVSKASVEDFPLMMQQQSPRWCSSLEAFVDIVQVGKDKDAFFVCVRTRKPNTKPVLDFLVELRLEYLRTFGRAVDFNCTCHLSVNGEYYVNLAPVACMRKIQVPSGEGCLGLDFDYLNPESGETVTKTGLPVATVDSSQGKGNLHASSAACWAGCLEGRSVLTRLYDFNRKTGSLPIAQRMVAKLFQ